jgi:hypothetical protein
MCKLEIKSKKLLLKLIQIVQVAEKI